MSWRWQAVRHLGGGLLIGLIAASLASCQGHPESSFWTVDGHCATAASLVSETADPPAPGGAAGASWTRTRTASSRCSAFDFSGCFIYVTVDATLWKRRASGPGSFVCATGYDLALVEAHTAAAGTCGQGYYRVVGVHEAARSSTDYTGSVSVTPYGYNA